MSLETDIKWITKELHEVKDPDFIELIKNMIQSRKEEEQAEESVLTKAQREEVLCRSELYKQGKTKVYTLNEAKEKLRKIPR